MKKKQEDEPIIEDKAKKVEEPKKEKKTRAKKSEEIKETEKKSDKKMPNKEKEVDETAKNNNQPEPEKVEPNKVKKIKEIDDISKEKVESILKKAKENGKITYGELANELENTNPDQIEEVFDTFEGLGVEVLKDGDLDSEPDMDDLREVKRTKTKVPAKGDNVETQIDVGIKQAFYGTNKKISLRTVDGKMTTFDVKIPAGIRNGEKIRLIGQGKQGQNGGKNGDLFIKVNIEDSNIYKLHGYDIYTDLLLTPWEAVLGTKAQIETIDGESKIYVPQGVVSGEKIKIPAKGYKDGKGGRGDLIAQVKIVVPKNPSKEEIEIYEKLKNISKFEPRNKTTIS